MNSGFWYVYMLRSINQPEHYYVGFTEHLAARLKTHNGGRVPHTAKFAPWRIETAVAFLNKDKAVAFERYLKTHSGRAFAKKHF